MKNVLFVLAHLDDEVFSTGTIQKMKEQGGNVHILIICGNGCELNECLYHKC